MKEIVIEEPHGFMKDSNDNICLRFGNWESGAHVVPDYVDARRNPQYVAGPAAHQQPLHEDYRQ